MGYNCCTCCYNHKKIPPEIWLRKFQRCGELVEPDLDGPNAGGPIVVEEINLQNALSPRSDSVKSPREKRADQRKKRKPSDTDKGTYHIG